MQKKHMLKLLLLVAIIIAVPFAFFQYIGKEPMREEKKASGKIVIVNEDKGYQYEENEPLILGNDIVPTLQGDSEYEWVVASRASAQAGLANQEYDAIVYIDSSFSENIMSFQDSLPNRASVQYEIYNNLNAENQERVQKELESAQLKMNQQISTQYWRYVSEEVDRVRNNFDEVLQKEVDFLNEMYSFYSPSSQELADEIETQRGRLDQLFATSSDTVNLSESSRTSLEEAQAGFDELTNAIDTYMAYHNEQTEMMVQANAQNGELVNQAVADYQQTLQAGSGNVQEGQHAFAPQLSNEGDKVVSLFDDWAIGAYKFNGEMNGFNSEINQVYAAQDLAVDRLPNAQAELIGKYANATQGERAEAQFRQTLSVRRHLSKDERPPQNIPRPEQPEEALEPIDEDLLKDAEETIAEIEKLVGKLNPEEIEFPEPPPPEPEPGDGDGDGGDGDDNEQPTPPEPGDGDDDGNGGEEPPPEPTEPPEDEDSDGDGNGGGDGDGDGDGDSEQEPPAGDGEQDEDREEALSFTPFHAQLVTFTPEELQIVWEEAMELLDSMEPTLEVAQWKIDDHREVTEAFLEYVEKLERYATRLEKYVEKLEAQVIDPVIEEVHKQEQAVFNRIGASPSVINSPIQSTNVRELLTYYGELAKLDWAYSQQGYLNQDRIKQIVDEDNRVREVQEKIDEARQSVDSFMGKRTQLEEAQQSVEEAEAEFNQFITDANNVLNELEQAIAEEQQAIREEVAAIAETGNAIGANLSESYGAIETEPAPVEGLNGQMVVTNQQMSLGEVQQLGAAVESLSNRQDDIIAQTEDLHNNVTAVQAKSDDLNSRWSDNVQTTELVYEDIHTILGNALSDGHHNDYVYNHLSSPVDISGEQVTGPAERMTPPIIVLVIVLLSSLLIGFLTHHYSSVPIAVNIALFSILSIIVGLVISIYGLTIYTMSESQSIQWTIITVLLILATAGLIRVAFMAGPWVGWLLSVAFILFFTSPLLDMAMPNFRTNNPIAELYISIQASPQNAFLAGMIPLALIAAATIALPIIRHLVVNSRKEEDDDYEM
ncbi:type VII secretion protein EsaA [Shouchella clausii]|uniref:type VII secretion protein EsaA n=1 Tax=Shouchella clausii TaxID=79880 RepID=UPI000BA77C1C|nr:type VII secretion protein EsaA [Shouchella clausii]MBU8596194.1 type VII secretion protein EsaA [Shouchella clausii]PAD09845.1 type VII secretion protein EsaA [Shouchella clausii]PAE84449.1 type VII secretion protein EsaA [Shouchella clausii]PAF06099.1 type VII secretion protein EsaA [Shouchella clausii]